MLDKSIKNKKVLTLDVDIDDIEQFISSPVIDSSIVVTPIVIDGEIEYYECTIKVNDKIREFINCAYNYVNWLSKHTPGYTNDEFKTRFYDSVQVDILEAKYIEELEDHEE